jgi:tripartite-type tricarboxylate transporter receptor subunit TctC
MTTAKRILRRLACGAVLAGAGVSFAHAQGARTAPVRMMIGFPPGGNVDILARVFGEQLSHAIGRPVVVENRPGAVGQIAADQVKAAAPDGNTLMLSPDATVVVRPHTLRHPTFNPLTDFAAVAHVGQTPTAFAVNAAVPAKTLREFAAWAKGHPDGAAFASPGAGGSMHFLGLLISQEIGVPLRHVPYKGSGPAVSDTAAGHVSSTVQPLGTLLTQASAGKIRLIGVSGTKRLPSVPDAPTFAEQGFPQLDMENWFAIFAPAATPAAIVNRYNAILVKSMRTPAIRERMRSLDLNIREMSPSELTALVKRDYERWGAIVRNSGFPPTD